MINFGREPLVDALFFILIALTSMDLYQPIMLFECILIMSPRPGKI